jgi:hypothetical protein
MKSTTGSDLHSRPRPAERQLLPGTEAVKRYLLERGYAQHTISGYIASAAHFLQWSGRVGLSPEQIDENTVGVFIDQHIEHSA